MANLEIVNPCDFYMSLSKKEKSLFLDYLHKYFDMRPTTIMRKLSKKSNYSLSLLEKNAILKVINEGLWK